MRAAVRRSRVTPAGGKGNRCPIREAVTERLMSERRSACPTQMSRPSNMCSNASTSKTLGSAASGRKRAGTPLHAGGAARSGARFAAAARSMARASNVYRDYVESSAPCWLARQGEVGPGRDSPACWAVAKPSPGVEGTADAAERTALWNGWRRSSSSRRTSCSSPPGDLLEAAEGATRHHVRGSVDGLGGIFGRCRIADAPRARAAGAPSRTRASTDAMSPIPSRQRNARIEHCAFVLA